MIDEVCEVQQLPQLKLCHSTWNVKGGEEREKTHFTTTRGKWKTTEPAGILSAGLLNQMQRDLSGVVFK